MGFPATFPATFPNGAGGATNAPAGVASGTGAAQWGGWPDTWPATWPGGAGAQVVVTGAGQANAGLASGTGTAPAPATTGGGLPPFSTTPTDITPTLQGSTFGGPSSSGCTNSVVTTSGAGVLHDMGGASASTPDGTSPAVPTGCFTVWNDQPAPDSTYNWESVRWQCRPDLDTQSVAGYYWANQGAITSATGDFGNIWYAGLQSRGSLSGSPKALNFAIWGGVDGVAGPIAGTVVAPFTGEGDGYQCIAPYSWTAGRTYSLQFSADRARGARWFCLHIKDETTGIVTWLGSLRAGTTDSSYVRGVDYQFSELFSQVSPAATCPLLPRSTTWFGPPTYSGTPVQLTASGTASAEVATGTGSAPQPTVVIPGRANAEAATGTGAALDATTTGAGGLVAGGFDGSRWPKLIVEAGIGIAGAMVNISADNTGSQSILSFSRSFGRSSPLDSCDVGTATIVFDNRSGAYDPMNASGAYTALDVGTPIHVLAEFPLGTLWDRFTGTITDIAVDVDTGPLPLVTLTCADGLEQLGRTQLAAELRTFTFFQTGDRIYDLATEADWPTGPRAIDLGIIPTWQTMELGGTTVLDLMQQIEKTEMGLLFVAEDGTLTFWDRHHHQTASRSTTTQLTLADGAGATVVRMAELSFSRSRDLVFNDIHLTREADPAQDPDLTGSEPGDEPREMTAADATSIGSYGHLNLPADVGKLHSSDAAVKDQADMLLNQYKAITDRVQTVTVNALHPKVKVNNLWDEILALTLLDRISVSRTYRAGVTLSATLLVQAISEEITANPPGWTLTLTTAGVPPTINRFILGTSSVGTNSIGW